MNLGYFDTFPVNFVSKISYEMVNFKEAWFQDMRKVENFLLLLCSVDLPLSAKFIEERIVGGKNAVKGQFPYLVHLDATYVNKDQKAFTAECTGSIISNRWILTAGHCVDTKIEPNLTLEKVMIKYGEVDVREGVYHDIEKAVIHPDYIIEGSGSDATTYYDIALVKTSKAIEYGEYVGEVCLASKMTMEGSCTSIGFGATVDALLVALGRKQERNFHLQYAPLTYVPGSQYAVRPYMIGFKAFVSYPNFGDSGGPLICEGQQLGVDSLGFPLLGFSESVYTSAYYFKDWIEKEMALDVFRKCGKAGLKKKAVLERVANCGIGTYDGCLLVSIFVCLFWLVIAWHL